MGTRREFLGSSLAIAAASTIPAGIARGAAKPRFTSNPFALGVASGYPTPGSVILWTRLAPSPLEPGGGMTQPVVPVVWEVATDDKMKSVVKSGTAYATADWAYSVHAEATDLEAGREYWYRFTAGDVRSPVGRTRTAPAMGAAVSRLRLAVASCQQYEHGYFTAYKHMLDDELDAIVHVGDYIYEHTWGSNLVRHHGAPEIYTLDDYRARYALYKSDPDLAAAHAAYPWFVTWDDHEVENDYAADLSENKDDPAWFLARRAAAYRAFYEHMPLPPQAIPFGPNMRLYAAQSFGQLASLSMLDGRQYRSPLACPRPGRAGSNRVTNCAELESSSRTMLGQRQEEWLQAQLTTNRAQWNLMAQGVVMAYIDEDPGADKTFWTDGWNGYPTARARLMNGLIEGRITNPVVLSGDIHAFVISGLHSRAAELDSPVVASEVVTTSISSQALAQKTLDAWRKVNPNLLLATSEHRGYARLDITPQRLQTDLIVVESVRQPDAGRRTMRSFVIENGRPAPVGA